MVIAMVNMVSIMVMVNAMVMAMGIIKQKDKAN